MNERQWHILDAGSIWIREFASALTRTEDVLAWVPQFRWTGFLPSEDRGEMLADPPVRLIHFPLQRGYHRFPISALVPSGRAVCARLLRRTQEARNSPLICTTPYYAPVAERWPGPVVYYQTDLTVEYAGVDKGQVRRLDRRMCRVADAVCPNSRRVAAYLVEQAGCAPDKIEIVPNATRRANVFDAPPAPRAGALPDDIADLPRPVLGVIGNLAANMDWELLLHTVRRTTPACSWAFVGPVTMEVPEPAQARARAELLRLGGRVRFTGPKPYGVLRDYARAFDAAVLPYRRKEPTFSGSSTRFYEHLAACRPMISTRGFEELLHKEPLLTLIDTPGEAADAVAGLAARGFDDGRTAERWQASLEGTWEVRAASVVSALRSRLGQDRAAPESRPGQLAGAAR